MGAWLRGIRESSWPGKRSSTNGAHGFIGKRLKPILLVAFSEYQSDVVVLFRGIEVEDFVDYGSQGRARRERAVAAQSME